MVDGRNTYGFCGGDPVNRSDPMGTWWFWDSNKNDWVWIGKGTPTIKPPIHEGSWGHHYVTRAKVRDRAGNISSEALSYLEGGEGMFTGWPKGLPPPEWHNRRAMGGVSHTMHDNYIEGYLDVALESHKAKGTKMTIDEATELGEFMKGKIRSEDFKVLKMKDIPKGYVNEVVTDFSRACVAERDMLAAERKAALAAEETASRAKARNRKGFWSSTSNKVIILTTIGAIAMGIDQRVEGGESLGSATWDTARTLVTELPKQPVLQVESSVVTALNAQATEERVIRVLQDTSNARERDRYAVSIDKAYSSNPNSSVWVPRGGETVRAFDDQVRAHTEGALEGARDLLNETTAPIRYWGERGFLYFLSIGAKNE